MKFDWDGRTLEWTQTPNPLDPDFKGKNLDVCKNGCITTNGASSLDFVGLTLSSTPVNSLLDGVSDFSYAYSVGYKSAIADKGPAYILNPRTTFDYGKYWAKMTKLYVWHQNVQTTTKMTTTTTTEAPPGCIFEEHANSYLEGYAQKFQRGGGTMWYGEVKDWKYKYSTLSQAKEHCERINYGPSEECSGILVTKDGEITLRRGKIAKSSTKGETAYLMTCRKFVTLISIFIFKFSFVRKGIFLSHLSPVSYLSVLIILGPLELYF